jgi:hypothetical protein
MKKDRELYRQLWAEIEYAGASCSNRLMYQVEGKIMMARQLGALPKERATELEREIIRKRDFNNTIFRHEGNAGCPKHTSGSRGILYDEDGEE